MRQHLHVENVFDDNSPLIGRLGYYAILHKHNGDVHLTMHSGVIEKAGNINVVLREKNGNEAICFQTAWHSSPHINVLTRALNGSMKIFGASVSDVLRNVESIRLKYKEHIDNRNREAELSNREEYARREKDKAQALEYLKKLETAIANGDSAVTDSFLDWSFYALA